MSDPAGVDTSKGWFAIPGFRNGRGDRTLKEQMQGLEHALAEAKDRTVLDLGCAEGMISIEFAKAGARVTGLELLEHHLKVARVIGKGHAVEFHQGMIESCARERFEQHDIVLALSVLHKLGDCELGLRLAAHWARSLLVIRFPQWYDRRSRRLKSKLRDCTVDVPVVMEELGFKQERWIDAPPRLEPLEYWRRG